MDDLPNNASKAQIEDAKLMQIVMRDSLDPESFSFESDKADIERRILDIDLRLQRDFPSPPRPSTPHQAPDVTSVEPTSTTMASRSRNLPDWSGSGSDFVSQLSPLPCFPHRTMADGPKHSRLESTSRPSKRQRRNSDSLTSSDLSADDSIPSSPYTGGQLADLLRQQEFRTRQIAQQREAEERRKREHEDRQIALQMSAQWNNADAPPPSSQRSTPFNNDVATTRGFPTNTPRPGPLPLSTAQMLSGNRDAANRETYPSFAQPTPSQHMSGSATPFSPTNMNRARPAGPQSSQVNSHISVTGRPSMSQQYRSSTSKSGGQQSNPRLTAAGHAGPSEYAGNPAYRVPGSFPGSDVFSQAHDLVYGRSSSSVRQNHSNPAYQHKPQQPMHSNPGRLQSHGSFGLSGLPGAGSASQPYTLDDDDDDEYGSDDAPPGRAFDLSRALADRNLGYLQADPSRSREELENLLKNIRPDEDLPPESRVGTPEAMKVALMEHQKLGLSWLESMESGTNKGGILADDMGLGKTIQALALILSRRPTEKGRNATLIIAPVALMRQWEREIETKCKPSHRLRVTIYHGLKKNKSFAQLNTYDVVLTTYGTVASELKRKEDFELKRRANPSVSGSGRDLNLIGPQCRWHRVILDEAQCIKNKLTRTSRAVCHLDATFRLCMTGTPMMNNVGELYALIKFLRIAPYEVYETFSHDIGRPLSNGRADERDRAMGKLQVVIKAIMLRRTKTSEIDGKPILTLPPCTINTTPAAFDEDQKAFYDHLQQQTALRVNKYLKAGTIGKNYSNILVLLLRLRQTCDHPSLIQDHGVPEGAEISANEMEDLAQGFNPEVVRRVLEANGVFECPICMEPTENPSIFFPCGHDVCSECFTRVTDPATIMANGSEEAKCPECRSKLDTKKVMSYSIFIKVHDKEQYRARFGGAAGDAENDDESGTEDDSDDGSEDASDVDGQANIRDFIAADDEAVEEEPWSSDEDEKTTKAGEAGPGRSSKTNPTRDNGKEAAISKLNAQGKGKDTKCNGKKDKQTKEKKKKLTLADLKRLSTRNVASRAKYLKRLRKNFVSSAKIDAAMELLERFEQEARDEKIIIFSQFTTFLDFMEIPIGDRGYKYRRYDGSMSAALRAQAVEDFMDKADVKIMLISLRAGNAGLNLTAASKVIIMEPFWNPFIEMQAIDRVNRIGQVRPVEVHKVVVTGTVEDRIVELQEKKRQLISEALDEKASSNLGRLGVRELQYLFGLTSSVDG